MKTKLLLISIFFMYGCGDGSYRPNNSSITSESTATSTATAETTPAVKATTASDTTSKTNSSKVKKPNKIFNGIIITEQNEGTSINKKTVTYTISDKKIKRESSYKSGVRKFLLDKEINGIICDLVKNEVLLYRATKEKKYYVKLSIDKYLTLRKTLLLSKNRLGHYGFGSIFIGAPQDIAFDLIEENLDFNGYICDKKEKSNDKVYLMIHQWNEINVNQKLLGLVEANYPKGITGFPVNILKKNLFIKKKPSPQKQSKFKKFLKSAVNVVKNAKVLLEYKMQIKEVIEKELDNDVFSLTEDFELIESFTELEEKTITKEPDIEFDD